MSAEERERGPEAGGVAPPGGVTAARDEPAAREAAPTARPAETAAADAPGDAPATSEPTTPPGEAAPSDAPGEAARSNAPGDEPAASEPTARPGEAAPSDAPSEAAPSGAPGDEPAAAAAPEATDTAAGEPAAAASDAMRAAAPDVPAVPASDAMRAAAPDVPAVPASDAMPNAPDEQADAATDAMPAAAAPDPPAVPVSDALPPAAGEPAIVGSDAMPAASEPGLAAVAGARDGLDAADLRAVLAAVFPSGTPCRHWCARPDAIGPLAAGLPADLAAWAEGRAWSAGVELRWQQDGPERYRALYLADGETLPEGFVPLGTGLRAVPGEAEPGLYLWGRRGDDGRYHATRLPRALDYPAAAGAEVRVPYQRLVGPDGMVRFLRLTLGEES